MKSVENNDETKALFKLAKRVTDLTGVTFSPNQLPMIRSRISNYMRRHKIKDLNSYIKIIDHSPTEELEKLVSNLTTHHTFFYRESIQLKRLTNNFLAKIIKNKRKGSDRNIRIWSAACSRGHEPYTLAVIVFDYLQKNAPDIRLEIYGTDIDHECVRFAKNAVYHQRDLGKLPKNLLDSYFSKGTGEIKNYYRVKKKIRDLCIFQTHNMTVAPSFIKEEFDFIFCRNLFIYFEQSQIKRSMSFLVNHLVDDGRIFLGLTEHLECDDLGLLLEQDSIYHKKPANFVQKVDEKSEKTVAPETISLVKKEESSHSDKIRVLIVEDSKTIIGLLKLIFSHDQRFEVSGVAKSSEEAEVQINNNHFDLITLDLNLPGDNGVSFLKRNFPKFKIPTIIISSLSKKTSNLVWDALDAGAIDYIEKPGANNLRVIENEILEMAWNAARQRNKPSTQIKQTIKKVVRSHLENRLILIGSSTGGTVALKQIMESLPSQIPPILIVQHIPEGFSQSFAARMNELVEFTVTEAKDGDIVRPNQILIAPGSRQMTLEKSSDGVIRTRILDKDESILHNPSVDVLFESALSLDCHQVEAFILTGMGKDGAVGMSKLKMSGARTMAQNEESCVVYGMPKAAVMMGAAMQSGDLDDIATAIAQGIKAA